MSRDGHWRHQYGKHVDMRTTVVLLARDDWKFLWQILQLSIVDFAHLCVSAVCAKLQQWIVQDALVNILDVVQAVEITLALDTPWEPELTECEFATIDTTSDGVINLFDLLFLVDVVVSK